MQVIIDGVPYVPVPAVLEPTTLAPGDSPRDLWAFLRKLRERDGLSLDDAARQIGITRQYLWYLESGKVTNPSFQVMIGLSRVYEFSLDSAAKMFG